MENAQAIMKNRKTEKAVRILLIDDDQASNYYNQYILNNFSADLTLNLCTNATEALRYLRSISSMDEIPHVILLDINMPGMDGWEFLEAFEGLILPYKDRIKIYMLSSSNNPHEIARAESNPLITQYLCKPLKREIIYAVLKELE